MLHASSFSWLPLNQNFSTFPTGAENWQRLEIWAKRKVARTALYVGLRVRARLHKGDRGRAAVADHAAAGRIIAQHLARALALLLHRRPPPQPDAPAH